jgi:hypothetical protein
LVSKFHLTIDDSEVGKSFCGLSNLGLGGFGVYYVKHLTELSENLKDLNEHELLCGRCLSSFFKFVKKKEESC